MRNEEMLEYLMLERVILNNEDGSEITMKEEIFDIMVERMLELEDKFINQYKPTIPIIKDPEKDDIATEE